MKAKTKSKPKFKEVIAQTEAIAPNKTKSHDEKLDDALAIIMRVREDKAEREKFFREVIGCEFEDFQTRIVHTVFENERTAISACHDVGKTFTVAEIILGFGVIFPRCKILTTAPTWRQVEHVLWSEIRTNFYKTKVPLGGTMLQTQWKLDDDWFAMGLTVRAEAGSGQGQGTDSAFQGFHGEYVFVFFDEATGIPPNIWKMVEGMMTSQKVKLIAIGNPTSKNCDFYKCFHDPAWAKIKLSCFDSPNLKANGVMNRADLEKEIEYCRTLNDEDYLRRLASYKAPKPYLLTLKWCVDKIRKWGWTHPLTLGKILGEFPDEGENVMVPLSLVEASILREVKAEGRRSLGVDIARFGTDSTVFTYLHGLVQIGPLKKTQKKDLMETVGDIVAYCKELGWPETIVIDETGVGGGVVDRLRELKSKKENVIPQTTQVIGVQFGAKAAEDDDQKLEELSEKYTNRKARMYGEMRDAFKEGLKVLDEDAYREELPTVQFKYDSRGRMIIESKEDYKRRTGLPSPDASDSLALAVHGQKLPDTLNLFPKAGLVTTQRNRSFSSAITSAMNRKGNAW